MDMRIEPLLFDFEVRLVDFLRGSGDFGIWPATFFQFWRVVLDPAVDSGVIDVQSTL
jgi:hypothetical protein